MKNQFKPLLIPLTLIAISLLTPGMFAQSGKLVQTNTGNMTLSGTSTLHDWTMNGVFQVEGTIRMTEDNRSLQSLNSLRFQLPVENLKSDKKKLDETAYKALKTDTYKDITFVMSSATVRSVQNQTYAVTAVGNLTIAGVTKSIIMNVNMTLNPDQTITCVGNQKLKMTDYKVQPPSFLGLMKTGDEIALDFSFQFKS